MEKLTIAVSCIILLAGCATNKPSDLRLRQPYGTYKSLNNFSSTTSCVFDEWDSVRRGVFGDIQINSKPIDQGYSVWIELNLGLARGEAVQLSEITGSQDGTSTITYYGAGNMWYPSLEKCASAPRKSSGNAISDKSVASGSTIESRLNELQSLKRKGLLTEEEYQTKRKVIIDQM